MMNLASSQIKALILLCVFSLNTVVGFACSLGMDMSFNSKHHEEEVSEAVVHVHKDGKEHIHKEKKNGHDHSKPHHHDQSGNDSMSKENQDSCCNDEVLQFNQLDKSVPYSLNIIHPNFLLSFFDIFYSITFPSLDVVKDPKQLVRNHHPPIHNIRIAIQSFQI